MPISRKKILKNLKNRVTLHFYDSIDSTNNEARRRAGLDEGFHLYVAAEQTAGRGRQGHSFYSPGGTGLYMTLALPLRDSFEDISFLTCAAGVAVCETVEQLSGIKPRIKWVNDIFVSGKKVAGILAELICADENSASAVIVGIGVNLRTEVFPADIADIAGSIGDIEAERLCAGIVDRLIGYYEDLNDISVLEKYKALNLCIGRDVSFAFKGKKITARAVDIDSGGGLVVDINGELVTLNSGEISVSI